MASTEGPARVHDRHARRRPFASWMKRLANLKSSHAESTPNGIAQRRLNIPMTPKYKKSLVSKNNPFPVSSIQNGHLPPSPPHSPGSRHSSLSQSKQSITMSHDGQPQPKSRAPTLATTAETAISDAGLSGAGTSATAAKTDGDHNSTFSSPTPSLRSMTTTLTTVQSTAPPTGTQNTANANHSFNPNTITPAPSIPAHLAPHAHPTTYSSATANNVLTDDASILTLASSSKRRRRNSVDTNASMRALAPASMFGGSRESLPLSVLSGTIIHSANTATDTASLRAGTGVSAPALASERNSYIGTTKYSDATSIRSGLLGAHGRNGSLSGSIGGVRDRDMVTAPTSPLADGMTGYMPLLAEKEAQKGRLSRRSSAWSKIPGDEEDEQEHLEHNGKHDL